MEIKKLDREKHFEEIEEKKRKRRERRALARSRKDELEREPLSMRKKRIYFSLLAALLIASAFNLYLNRALIVPPSPQESLTPEKALTEFDTLCIDIEEYKNEWGKYPESIEDMKFSPHLLYQRSGDGSFLLVYNDGQAEYRYDSSKDSDRIK